MKLKLSKNDWLRLSVKRRKRKLVERPRLRQRESAWRKKRKLVLLQKQKLKERGWKRKRRPDLLLRPNRSV